MAYSDEDYGPSSNDNDSIDALKTDTQNQKNSLLKRDPNDKQNVITEKAKHIASCYCFCAVV